MEKSNTINKPIYKYKPISYYSNSGRKPKSIIEKEEEEEEEEFSYVMDENKINKLKEEKVKKGKNFTKSVEKDKSQKKEIISNIQNDTLKTKSLIDLGKNINDEMNINNKEIKNEENKESKIKSKSVHSLLNIPDYSELNMNDNNDEIIKKFKLDLIDNKKKEIEKKSKEKKSKKKIKKIKIKKKKSTNNNTNDTLNNINKKEISNNNEININNNRLENIIIKKDESKQKEIDFKKHLKSIIKIQSKWLGFKSKKKLKLLRFIKNVSNIIINKRHNNNLNYFISNLKHIKKDKSNLISVNSEKFNELLKKEKNYEILNIKYEEVLKELNEIKNKIIFKQNLNMVNNKNQNISINIFPTKENKKNNFVIDKKNEIIILKKNNKQTFNIYNLFYLLKNKYDFLIKYYYKKFMLLMNIQKNKEKRKTNDDLYIINKIKSFSLKKQNYSIKNNNIFSNMIISSQISNFIIPKYKKYLFQNLNIQNQSLLKINNIKENRLYISDKNEINIKKDKSKNKINKKKENYIINKTKSFVINKDETIIKENILNYIKNNKNILKKINEIFNIRYFNENEFYINKIKEIKYNKIKNKIDNIICKSNKNNFTLSKIHKSPINYAITKVLKNFKIKAKKKSNDFIITKNIKNLIIKGIDYSQMTEDVILYISDTYELTINSTQKKKERKKGYRIFKVINNYMIDIKKDENKKNNYLFKNNKLIINKTINNMKIIKNKKGEYIINKFKSNNFCIKGIKNNKNSENLVINKIISNYSLESRILNINNDIINNKCEDKNLCCEEIEKSSEEIIIKKRKKRKLKKLKKNKRFKFLFISDYNQLFIKKTKVDNNNSINELKISCTNDDK